MWQGHHPSSAGGNYTSSRPRTYPGFIGSPIDFTAFSGNGPWGRLGSPESITLAASIDFMFGAGYREHFSLEDDLITAAHLRKASAGGTNRFNDVDIGLYIGHASAGKQAETATGLFVPQAYIPIYNSAANSWDWVRTTDSEFGSERLKWMHLLVCNYFRASPYRSDAIFDGLRNSGALPINTDLHVLSSMASEVWLSVRFGELWVKALMGEFGPGNSSVVDAWGYAVRRSQRWRDYVGSGFEWNVARSIYWPECRNDRIYGFGQQTTPDPNNVQAGLEFHDTTGAPW